MYAERNAEICKHYTEGKSLHECAELFTLSHQSIRSIVRKGGVFKRKEPRPAFIGVDVTQEVKDKLRDKASALGTSSSRLASEAIEQSLETK